MMLRGYMGGNDQISKRENKLVILIYWQIVFHINYPLQYENKLEDHKLRLKLSFPIRNDRVCRI